jgi:hypothetical protein
MPKGIGYGKDAKKDAGKAKAVKKPEAKKPTMKKKK